MSAENKLAQRALIIAIFMPLILSLPFPLNVTLAGLLLFIFLYIIAIGIYEARKKW